MTRYTPALAALMMVAATFAGTPASAASPTAVSAKFSATQLQPGQQLTVKGAVKPRGVRAIQVQRRVGTTWVRLRSAKTSASGTYSTSVPTYTVGAAAYRVVAGSKASASRRISIAARGSSRGGTLTMGKTARWNPCRTIGVRVNLGGQPKTHIKDVRAALTRITAQTGLRFSYRGTTNVLPGGRRGTYPRDTDVIVAWTRPGATSYFPADSRALAFGGASATEVETARGRVWQFYHGFVVIDKRRYGQLTPGFSLRATKRTASPTRGKLLLHELGHALGLGHNSRDAQAIMHPTLYGGPTIWSRADARMLTYLDASRGCIVPQRSGARVSTATAASALFVVRD